MSTGPLFSPPGDTRDDMGPLLLVACATVVVIELAGVVKPERGVPLSIIGATLGILLAGGGALWMAGAVRRVRERRRARAAEQHAEMVRAQRLIALAHELRREGTESGIHRRFVAQAALVVAHDESDLVVFPRGELAGPRRHERAAVELGVEASALERRVAETGAAAHRASLDRGRPCYQVAVPVRTTDGLLAILTMRRAMGSFTAAELDAAARLCAHVGVALERSRTTASHGLLLS